jgi:hypothetical protein
VFQKWDWTYTRENKKKKKKMEMQQMMEFFRKELRADREYFMKRMEANRKKDKEEMEAIKARTATMREKLGASHMEMVSAFKPEIEEETMAYQEIEAHPEEEKEPTSVYRKPEVAQKQEVPVEDTEVMPVGEPKKKRRRHRKLAMERGCQEPKDMKRINGGPQEKLAAARKGTTHREKVTRHMKVTDRKVARQIMENDKDVRPSKNCPAQENCQQEKLHHGRD